MNSADNMVVDGNIMIMFKGPFGGGKTIAACSFAANGPVYLAYIDKKKPIELHWFKRYRPDILSNIKYDVYGSTNIYELLNLAFRWQKTGCPFSTVVIDSVTTLTSSAVNWSLGWRTPEGKRDLLNAKAPQLIPDFDEYKVETSLVTQLIDIFKMLPVTSIWIAHPVPSIKVEQTGAKMTVTKQNNIVSYGQKVGAMLGGQFAEIYHFGRMIDRRIIYTDMTGEDFAKTALNLPFEFEITNRLFYEVWSPLVTAGQVIKEVSTEVPTNVYDPSSMFPTKPKEEPNQIATDWNPSWK